MTRIVVCGSRGFEDYQAFQRCMDVLLRSLDEPMELVSGHASGADRLAERYASENSIPIHIIRPDWKTYGKAAGPIRNRKMLEYTSAETPVVIAFWDGESRGTKHTIDAARSMDINVYVIRY